MQTTYVHLKGREYDCSSCGTAHDYFDDIYDSHQGYALNYGRWIYGEVNQEKSSN